MIPAGEASLFNNFATERQDIAFVVRPQLR
jgi:hypothetical protein